jgi:hypothetical protein
MLCNTDMTASASFQWQSVLRTIQASRRETDLALFLRLALVIHIADSLRRFLALHPIERQQRQSQVADLVQQAV